MTFCEVTRAVESFNRRKKLEFQERASFDYILADLIGRSVARVLNSQNKLPEINEAYPNIFDDELIEQKRVDTKMELSAIRFRKFAEAYQNKMNKKEVSNTQ